MRFFFKKNPLWFKAVVHTLLWLISAFVWWKTSWKYGLTAYSITVTLFWWIIPAFTRVARKVSRKSKRIQFSLIPLASVDAWASIGNRITDKQLALFRHEVNVILGEWVALTANDLQDFYRNQFLQAKQKFDWMSCVLLACNLVLALNIVFTLDRRIFKLAGMWTIMVKVLMAAEATSIWAMVVKSYATILTVLGCAPTIPRCITRWFITRRKLTAISDEYEDATIRAEVVGGHPYLDGNRVWIAEDYNPFHLDLWFQLHNPAENTGRAVYQDGHMFLDGESPYGACINDEAAANMWYAIYFDPKNYTARNNSSQGETLKEKTRFQIIKEELGFQTNSLAVIFGNPLVKVGLTFLFAGVVYFAWNYRLSTTPALEPIGEKKEEETETPLLLEEDEKPLVTTVTESETPINQGKKKMKFSLFNSTGWVTKMFYPENPTAPASEEEKTPETEEPKLVAQLTFKDGEPLMPTMDESLQSSVNMQGYFNLMKKLWKNERDPEPLLEPRSPAPSLVEGEEPQQEPATTQTRVPFESPQPEVITAFPEERVEIPRLTVQRPVRKIQGQDLVRMAQACRREYTRGDVLSLINRMEDLTAAQEEIRRSMNLQSRYKPDGLVSIDMEVDLNGNIFYWLLDSWYCPTTKFNTWCEVFPMPPSLQAKREKSRFKHLLKKSKGGGHKYRIYTNEETGLSYAVWEDEGFTKRLEFDSRGKFMEWFDDMLIDNEGWSYNGGELDEFLGAYLDDDYFEDFRANESEGEDYSDMGGYNRGREMYNPREQKGTLHKGTTAPPSESLQFSHGFRLDFDVAARVRCANGEAQGSIINGELIFPLHVYTGKVTPKGETVDVSTANFEVSQDCKTWIPLKTVRREACLDMLSSPNPFPGKSTSYKIASKAEVDSLKVKDMLMMVGLTPQGGKEIGTGSVTEPMFTLDFDGYEKVPMIGYDISGEHGDCNCRVYAKFNHVWKIVGYHMYGTPRTNTAVCAWNQQQVRAAAKQVQPTPVLKAVVEEPVVELNKQTRMDAECPSPEALLHAKRLYAKTVEAAKAKKVEEKQDSKPDAKNASGSSQGENGSRAQEQTPNQNPWVSVKPRLSRATRNLLAKE